MENETWDASESSFQRHIGSDFFQRPSTSEMLSWTWVLTTVLWLATGTARSQDLPPSPVVSPTVQSQSPSGFDPQPSPIISAPTPSDGVIYPGNPVSIGNPGSIGDWTIPRSESTTERGFPIDGIPPLPVLNHPGPLEYKIPSYDPKAGFKLIDPVDPTNTPCSLTFNMFLQPRYTGFSRSNQDFTQANGNVVPVNNTSDFQFIRLIPEFSGYVFDQKFYYHTFIFMTSTTNSAIPLGFTGYKFSDEFSVEMGYWKVAVNREFNTPYHKLFGTEWSMATTFFRPGFVPGANIYGTLFETLHYKVGLYDAFNGAAENWSPYRTNTNLIYSHDLAWEPLGTFGPEFEDFGYSESPLVRFGSGFAAGRGNAAADDISGPGSSVQNPNNTIFRASDGTPLNAIGLLGPGVAVRAANLNYLTVDAEFKHRGFNIGAEYNFRWLDNFTTEGGAPNRSQLFDHGGWLYAGYFLRPKQMMAYAKSSLVSGTFGTGWEAGGGVAYYPFKNINTRLTLECLYLNRSPASNPLTPYLWPGQTGALVMAGASIYF